MPVIKHLDGNCHVYVDDPCDLEMALKVTDNAKTQKYSPCNAAESLLVARGVAPEFLPGMAAIFASKGCRCAAAQRVCPCCSQALAARQAGMRLETSSCSPGAGGPGG